MAMKHYRVFVAESALADLLEIDDWLSRTDVDGRAHIVVDALLGRIERLNRLPLRGSPVPEIDDIGFQDYRQTIHHGYRIIYRSDTSTVYVLAVLHQRRDIRTVMMGRAVRK